MKSLMTVLCLASLSFPASVLAAGGIPDQSEYAWRFPLRIEEPAEYLAAEIPLEVYRSVSDTALRDLGVYNAAGQAVPRIVEQPQEDMEDIEHETPLGMVRLYGEIEKSGEQLRLLMQSNKAGTTLQFDSALSKSADPELQFRALIVDLREHDERFDALSFEWSGPAAGFIGSVTLEDGDDLANWRRLARGTLAELEYDGTRIEQRMVELPRKASDFLRVTWRDMPDRWRPVSVTGIVRERGPEEAREWLTLDPVEQSEDGRVFLFDVGGYPPVDRVNLVLSGRNTAVRASVDYRHGADASWRYHHEGLFYQLSRAGNEISSSPARLSPSRAGQWRVRIHSGQVDGPLRLRLGWRLERLLFLSQGEPPYTLAAGRAQDRVEQFPQHRLLGDSGLFSMLEHSSEAGVARVGARQEAAGAKVMESARTWTWRTVVVWIGLIAAVLFVGWLAWSLMRETK